MRKWIALLPLLVFCSVLPVRSEASSEWRIDQDHSTVNFKVRHIFAMIPGEFSEFSGTVVFDPETPQNSVMEFVIDVRSIETGVGKRNGHLLSDDFFAVKRFPEIRFKSAAFRPKGNGEYDVEGDLTIKDVTRRVTLPLSYLGTKVNPLDKDLMVAGFESLFTLDRLEYNVGTGKFYDMGVVDRTAEMEIFLEVLQEK